MEIIAPLVATVLIGLMTWFIRQMIVSVKEESDTSIKKLKLEIEKMCDDKTDRVNERIDVVDRKAMLVDERLAKDEESYLTQEKHGLLCSNAQLELKAHISKELNVVFKAIRNLEKAVKNGNK